MKSILITGASSYIGTSFENYIKVNYPDDYVVDTVDMIDGSWREKNFAGYDAVFHVAGIAHQKETKQNAHLYYEINRDLAIETAQKAKNDGAKQFIFLSSMSIYGMDTGVITKETAPNPKSNYGKSKLQAENGINKLACDDFKVCILRPPMVYGEGCKGNYQALIKFARVMPFFPNYNNKRSMIHIHRLCWYVRTLVDECANGCVLPQDEDYVCTCKMVQQIAKKNGKKFPLLRILNPLVLLAKICSTAGKKAFGDLYYEK